MVGSFWMRASDPSTGQHGPVLATCLQSSISKMSSAVFSWAHTMTRATDRNLQDSFQTDNWISLAYQNNNAVARAKPIKISKETAVPNIFVASVYVSIAKNIF